MDSHELESSLVDLGLTEYQAAAYVALLDLGMASATTVADESSVPASRVYDVLRELDAESYVELVEQDTLHARPAPPETVLEDLRSRSERLENAADEIEERWELPAIRDHEVSVVKHAPTVVENASEAIGDAQDFVRVSGSVEQVRQLQPTLQRAKAGGCQVSLCVFDPNRSDLDSLPYHDIATEVRESYVPVPFLVIVDDATVCFTPHVHRWGEFGLIGHTPFLTYVFAVFYFASVWSPHPTAYRDEEWIWIFDSLRTFVHGIAPFLRDGIDIVVAVTGTVPDSGRERTVTGTVEFVAYPNRMRSEPESVRMDELLSYLTLYVRPLDEPDDVVTVGGWGTVYEDLQARQLEVVDLVLPDP